MEKQTKILDDLKDEGLSIINNIKINKDIFNKPLDEVKEYIVNHEAWKDINNSNSQSPAAIKNAVSPKKLNRKNSKIINFLVYGIAGSCITLGIFLGIPATIKTFKNAEDPITHYSRIFGYVDVPPEKLANENSCTKQNLKEQVKGRVIQENDIYKARVGCDIKSIELRVKQTEALNK